METLEQKQTEILECAEKENHNHATFTIVFCINGSEQYLVIKVYRNVSECEMSNIIRFIALQKTVNDKLSLLFTDKRRNNMN